MRNSFRFLGVLIPFLILLLWSACKPAIRPLGEEEKEIFLEQGLRIIGQSEQQIKAHLLSSLKRDSVQGAVMYCNHTVGPLVDTLSAHHQVRIRRTSEKYRNPADAPDPIEKEVLADYAKKIQNGELLEAKIALHPDGDKVLVYKPIIVQGLCLHCHGEPGVTLNAADNHFIKSLYPKDLATGYKEGELRGMWSLEFSRGQKLHKENGAQPQQ